MPSILEKYANYLPITDKTPRITIGECGTPLVKSSSIGPELGCELFFKVEGANPSGSFKDRGMVMAIAHGLERGYKKIVCASTGNTSAAAAAFGAHFDLDTLVLIPDGKIAMGKLAQAMAYGARIVAVKGNFDDAYKIVHRLGEEQGDVLVVNSINPSRLQGQKTASFEIVDELGDAPDYHCIPVGNGGNISSYWYGYKEYADLGNTTKLPKMFGFQAAGAAPIVNNAVVENPETVATAIRIGNPVQWKTAAAAGSESGGAILAREDEHILNAYKRMASEEGIFCEPAAAISVAGLLSLPERGIKVEGKTVVCTLTGNGLKDPNSAEKHAATNIESVDPKDPGQIKALIN